MPIFFGELGVPCTDQWTQVLEHVLHDFLDPLHLSATAWHYIDLRHCPAATCLLNLACQAGQPLHALAQHPGGVYQTNGMFVPMPADSRLYDDSRINPWDAGPGFFGDIPPPNFCASDPVFAGRCSLAVHFDRDNFAALKFSHHYGVGTRHYTTLTFQLFLPGAGQQNVKIFTAAPRSDCDPGSDPIFPPTYDQQPELRQFLSVPVVGQWQQVAVPLTAIVNPAEPIINGLALQNMGRSQDVFYLDNVRLIP